MKKWGTVLGVIAAAALVAQPAQAQVQFGVQGNYADDVDFGIGARAQFDVGSMIAEEGPLSSLTGVASVDYYFPDCGGDFFGGGSDIDCSYLEVNGNALYPLDIAEGVAPYVGAGVHFGRFSVEDVSDSEVGLNALGGLNFDLGGVTAFAEGKIELGGMEQFVITFGALLGGAE